jgi:protein-L-isoaspartate(D-aspartate) O-methyltransferase
MNEGSVMDFAMARRMMVEGQIRTRDVFDTDLLTAMLEVPRERFVGPAQAPLAYVDRDIPVTDDGSRCLVQPMVLARLLQAADMTGDSHVLDVGCATGYASALLARRAGTVVALEENADLVAFARAVLGELAPGVKVVNGPLTAGWPRLAPYDVIVLGGVVELVPDALFAQLKEGGRLVAVVGSRPATKAMVYSSIRGEVSGRPVMDAGGSALPGFAKPPAFVF